MEKGQMKFLELINNTKSILDMEMSMSENAIFVERYTKMQNYLQRLEEAYKIEKINKGRLCLDIVRMLDHGDSEQLVKAVSELNHHYQKNLYQKNSRS